MTGKQKMAQVVKHFDAILKLYPDNSVDMNIHDIKEKDIDLKVWYQCEREHSYNVYKRKSATNRTFDIDIFTKEEI